MHCVIHSLCSRICDDRQHGPSAFVSRAIKEHQLYGKQIVLVLPIPHPLNLLLQAGAQVYPIPADDEEVNPAGRVPLARYRDRRTDAIAGASGSLRATGQPTR